VRIRWKLGHGRSAEAAPSAPAAGCWAPDATLYFAPDGDVRACCVNTEYPLGRIGEQGIREIWEGARTRALRDALAQDDWSLGCQECGARAEAGNRAWSNAPQFDEFAGQRAAEWPRRLDFVLSNTCNLMCEMCHGDLSSAIRAKREHRPPMAKAYGDEFFEELRDFLPHLEQAVFLGGEPFLARESRRVLDLMLEMDLQIPTRIVTNGTQWNPKVERYLTELPIDLAASVDGATPETLEALRVGVDHAELHANLARYEAAMAPRGGTITYHYCLMVQNWHELGRFLLEADAADRHTIVMTVTGPIRFSLFDLDVDELGEVIAGLEAEDRVIGSQLGRNAQVWRDELDRLRRHHAALQQGAEVAWVHTTSAEPEAVPVEIGRAQPAAATTRDAREADAAAWAGRPPLDLHTLHGVIEQVEPPPTWAEALASETWEGLPVEQLPHRIGAVLGPASTPELTRHDDGVLEVRLHFDGADGLVPARALVDEGGQGRVLLYVADRTLSPSA
jgi:radical SAM protein with 4Fe4S-binding SPASM domain